ncbi:hypothetical protein ACOACO_16685 [Nocardioides sp. CPCC 205120]|uniref:hypothetical protein n=1 Tax=Nocardioides sp. CPCC 205120 TaxID=3406462 RepID=UPI003B50CC93
MSNTSLLRRCAAPVAAVLALLLLPSAGSAEPGPYPGLPQVEDPGPPFPETVGTPSDRNVFAWLNAPYGGLASSVRSEQWLRLPVRALASNSMFYTCEGPASPPGGDNPCTIEMDPRTLNYNALHTAAFLVSPDGSEQAYGDGPVIPVRTVAFGAIPVEVGIQMSQARDADGLPVPLQARIVERTTVEPGVEGLTNNMDPATLTGPVVLRVVGLAVDGVDLDLGDCRTPTIDLAVRSEAASGPVGQEYEWIDPQRSTYGFSGGGFNGVVDIPAFEGCETAAGDDVSAVLTSVISGPGNPVSVQYGAMFCFGEFTDEGTAKPTRPGADLPEEAGCTQYEMAPGGRWWAVPLPRDFPDRAPGDPEQ